MNVRFESKPNMFAVELAHYVSASMPLHVATLVTMEMGEPALRTARFSAWYGLMYTEYAHDVTLGPAIPFSIRIDIAGEVCVLVPFAQVATFNQGVNSMIPNLVLTERVA